MPADGIPGPTRCQSVERGCLGGPVLSPARVEIDGQPVPAGKDLRLGPVHRLEGDDLVVWIRKDATVPLRITVAPAGPDAAR
jgi:hypothetical protein